MIRLFALAALGSLAGLSLFAQDSAVGLWKHTDKDKVVVFRVSEEGGKLSAKIEKMSRGGKEVPEEKCVKCTGDLKDQPLFGLKMMWDLTKDGAGWGKGKILDPDDGKTYNCKVELASGGKELKVRGSIAFIGKTQTWSRLE
ncbi:MAG: DUF2147 domain-containing protein [Bryobacterales bacterium]|nr:DUF2147 domain-containing protein [Bryobacterales bacterium]